MAHASLKQLQKALLAEIGKRMPAFGFSAKPEGQAFYRDVPSGWWALSIGFIHHPADVDVVVEVGIRNDALEALLGRNDETKPGVRRQPLASFGAELGNISGVGQMRWTVGDEGDVPRVAALIVEEFERVGLPYLHRYADPVVMLDTLAANDQSAWLHSAIHATRCQKIVGLALLTGRTEDLDALIGRCRAFLRQRNDSGLNAFDQFVRVIQPKN